jgi:hypothetical protein
VNLLCDEGGSSLLEFSLFISVLILLFVGIVNYAAEIQQAMQIQEAATAGASFGVIPGNESNLSGMQQVAISAAPGVSGLTVTAANLWTCSAGGASVASTTTCSSGQTPYKYVVVTTSATVPTLLRYTGMPASLTLHGSATFEVPWSP